MAKKVERSSTNQNVGGSMPIPADNMPLFLWAGYLNPNCSQWDGQLCILYGSLFLYVNGSVLQYILLLDCLVNKIKQNIHPSFSKSKVIFSL